MLNSGLVDEVKRLSELGLLRQNTTAGGAIGYKELFGYLRGECSLDEAALDIKLASRRYAKRQLTWFRNKTKARVIFLDSEGGAIRNYSDILAEVLSALGQTN